MNPKAWLKFTNENSLNSASLSSTSSHPAAFSSGRSCSLSSGVNQWLCDAIFEGGVRARVQGWTERRAGSDLGTAVRLNVNQRIALQITYGLHHHRPLSV